MYPPRRLKGKFIIGANATAAVSELKTLDKK